MRAVFATRPERYVVLKDLLEDRRRDTKEEPRSLREALPAEIVDVKDAEEQSLDDLIRELDFALMKMKSAALPHLSGRGGEPRGGPGGGRALEAAPGGTLGGAPDRRRRPRGAALASGPARTPEVGMRATATAALSMRQGETQ